MSMEAKSVSEGLLKNIVSTLNEFQKHIFLMLMGTKSVNEGQLKNMENQETANAAGESSNHVCIKKCIVLLLLLML